MKRSWVDIGRAAMAFGPVTGGSLLAVGAIVVHSDAPILRNAIICAIVASLCAIPAWLIVVYTRPSFWTGAAAGVLAVLLGLGVAVVLLAWRLGPGHPEDERVADGGYVMYYYLIAIVFAGVVGVPSGAVIGGVIGVLQRQRHCRTGASGNHILGTGTSSGKIG